MWAQSIYSAREQNCLAPIRDFMLNYPWSRSRLAAQTGLNKWLGVFGATDCVQRSQVAQSACPISEGVRSGAFEGAGRIVVAPKRIPVSPVGPIVCEASNVPNPQTASRQLSGPFGIDLPGSALAQSSSCLLQTLGAATASSISTSMKMLGSPASPVMEIVIPVHFPPGMFRGGFVFWPTSRLSLNG